MSRATSRAACGDNRANQAETPIDAAMIERSSVTDSGARDPGPNYLLLGPMEGAGSGTLFAPKEAGGVAGSSFLCSPCSPLLHP